MGPRLFSRGNGAIISATERAILASMGPRLFSRGNLLVDSEALGHGQQLQWGHGYSAVETSGLLLFRCLTQSLQWGHGYSAVETQSD